MERMARYPMDDPTEQELAELSPDRNFRSLLAEGSEAKEFLEQLRTLFGADEFDESLLREEIAEWNDRPEHVHGVGKGQLLTFAGPDVAHGKTFRLGGFLYPENGVVKFGLFEERTPTGKATAKDDQEG